MKKIVLAALVLVSLAGCSTQQFLINGRVDDTIPANSKDSHDFFIGGIGQTKTVDAANVCGSADRVLQVQTKQTFINGFLGLITFGIYTPREYSVYCKK